MRTSSFRFVAPICVVAALLAPPARAAGWASSPFEGIWARLAALWNATGCVIDPSGGCGVRVNQARGVFPAGGCVIDPNGRCGNEAPPTILFSDDQSDGPRGVQVN